jgi:hypothetical protein
MNRVMLPPKKRSLAKLFRCRGYSIFNFCDPQNPVQESGSIMHPGNKGRQRSYQEGDATRATIDGKIGIPILVMV